VSRKGQITFAFDKKGKSRLGKEVKRKNKENKRGNQGVR